MEKVFKVLDCEVKKLEDRVYEFTASTSTQDRDGEVIEPLGWDLKNFKKNPVIMYAHDYRSLPVGKAPRVWVSNGTLKNTVEFPPEGTYEFADIVERLVNTGYLKTESVGFIPKKWEDGDGEKAPRRTYTKQELLEISIVPVPSNPDALRNAISDGVITVKEFGALTEPEVVEEAEAIDENIASPDLPYEVREIPSEDGKNKSFKLFPKETKPEEPDDFVRIPVAECDVTATIDISKEEVEQKEIPREKPITQEALKDELDYALTSIKEVGISDEAMEGAMALASEILGLTGNHIPEDILAKVGAVLNQKNKDRLESIRTITQQILDSAGKPEQESIIEPEVTKEEIAKAVAGEVKRQIGILQGKV